MSGTRWLAAAPPLTVAVFLLPIAAGLLGTLLPAFGYLPALGGEAFSLEPWRRLAAIPGFATSVALTLWSGFAATLLSLLLATGFCALVSQRPWARRASAWLAPLLATPHSALAIGFAFVILPSGWIVRALSPWLTGWTLPPDVATVNDPYALALIAGLLLKETPYLILMIAGAQNQVPAPSHLLAARALGYGRIAAWLKVVFPQVYPQIRLPVYAVLAFSLSVVDVALILGPGSPPPLAVLAVRGFTDADLQFYFPAAAAATLLGLIVLAAIAAWHGGEHLVRAWGVRMLDRGRRDGATSVVAATAGAGAIASFLLAALALAGLALWSLATQWRFPAAWPDSFSLANWLRRLDGLAQPAWLTLVIGALATALALVLVLACLENEARRPRHVGRAALWLLYLPLLVPQVAFLFGAQVLLVRFSADGLVASVVWAHLIFVLPYLFLSLADPWRALDPRYARTAAGLGAAPARVFFRVKLPLLLKPILVACAVAFAVSAGQYLPTLFAGNGRVATLTTEAVTLASGADRRVIGAYALVQAALPMLVWLAAAVLPTLVYARRQGLAQR
jgi:putative thiamine transport system permease protein